jgi:hypothetical protein
LKTAICGNIGSSTDGLGSGTPKSAVCAFSVLVEWPPSLVDS